MGSTGKDEMTLLRTVQVFRTPPALQQGSGRLVGLWSLITVLLTPVVLSAQQGNFVAPKPYSASRYEAGWERNPFTLKTAPPSVQRESPVKDLVLYNSYSIGDKRTVILANVKTRERIKLSGTSPGPGGMLMKSYHQGENRRDSYVEIDVNGETAMLRYDDSFLKQMASKGGNAAQQKGTAGAAGAKKPADPAVAMNAPVELPVADAAPPMGAMPPPLGQPQQKGSGASSKNIPPPTLSTPPGIGPPGQTTANRRRGFSLPKNHAAPPPASR